MRWGRALLVLLVAATLAAPPADARARRRRSARDRPAARTNLGPGEVQFRTTTTAFLDRGTADGLKAGDTLTFTRNGRATGTCTVTTAAEHFATCEVGALRKGDKFDVVRRVLPAPSPPPPLAGEQELLRRGARLANTEHELVEADAGAGVALRGVHHFRAALSHTTFGALGRASGPFHVQQLDVNVDNLHVWKGLSVSADLAVLNFAQRPANFQSALRSSPTLLVRQLQVDWRTAEMPFSGSLGRVWTRHTPGLLVVDGVQGSWRNEDESLELGAYGGFLPDGTTLGVALNQGAAGGFVTKRFQSGERADARLVELEARVGWAGKTNIGGRLELGAAAHAYGGRTWDAHGAVEVGVGDGQGAAAIDAGRLDLGLRPKQTVRLWASGRYRGASPSGVVELGTLVRGQRAVHGDLGAQWEVSEKLWLALLGNAGIDLDADLWRFAIGPQATFPSLLGRAGSLSVGYREELGWISARQLWAQVVFSALRRLRLMAHASFDWQLGNRGSEGLEGPVLGLTLGIDVTLPWSLWVRLGATGRIDGTDVVGDQVSPRRLAGMATAQVGGAF